MSVIVSDTPQGHNTNGKNAEITPVDMAGQFETHFLLAPNMQAEIKNEPPEDIDDTPHNIYEGGQAMNGDGGALLERKPTITLTPTMKLLASPNPVDPKRKFPCPYENCTKSYGKSSHLRSHLTWHTGIKPYVCQELNCGKSFTRSDELNRHSRTHTGEKPFECMQCAKKFSRSDHLTKHVATHTKQMQTLKPRAARPPPSAEKPGSPPAPKKALTELTEMSLPQQGMNYDDGMHFMASLLECAQFKHGRHVLESENVNVEPPAMTKHMPIKIKLERPDNSDQYKVVNAATDDENTTLEEEGANEHEMVMPVVTVVRSTPTPSPPPHTTALVNTQAQSLINSADNDDDDFDEGDGDGEYTTDDDIVMPDANAPPLPLAGAPFAVPRFGFFEDDLDGIDPERPYLCSQCTKCFKRQDDLNRHLRTHTGEKPFSCEDCNKRFMRSDHLKKHMKTHSKHR